MPASVLGVVRLLGAQTIAGINNRASSFRAPPPAPVSATVRATKFPCIEYVFYFDEGKAVMPYRLWYVYISVKSESKTLILKSEK